MTELGDKAEDSLLLDPLAAELREVVANVRCRADLDRLSLPTLDDLAGARNLSREELIALGIEQVSEPVYRRFLQILLPLPFEGSEIWPSIGRKYVVEEEAGRGVRAGHDAFGVTTWDALNVPLGELDGASRRSTAERKLAESILALGVPPRRPTPKVFVALAVLAALVLGGGLWSCSRSAAEVETPIAPAESEPSTDTEGDGAAQVDSAPQTTEPQETATTETTVSLPQSELPGVQPGVIPVAGEDHSDEMALLLAEEELIFYPLLGAPVGPFPVYGLAFGDLPARYHFQAFNPRADAARCRGLMSRELEVQGLWERGFRTEEGQFQVSVGRLAEPWMAEEMATAIALGVGIDPENCIGMARFGVADYDQFGVVNRDEGGLIADRSDYNHWSRPESELSGKVWANSNRILLTAGVYAIDVAMVSDQQLPNGDAKALGQIATQILERL